MAGYGNRTARDISPSSLSHDHASTRLGLTDTHDVRSVFSFPIIKPSPLPYLPHPHPTQSSITTWATPSSPHPQNTRPRTPPAAHRPPPPNHQTPAVSPPQPLPKHQTNSPLPETATNLHRRCGPGQQALAHLHNLLFLFLPRQFFLYRR